MGINASPVTEGKDLKPRQSRFVSTWGKKKSPGPENTLQLLLVEGLDSDMMC